jgi:hypothetical protein
MSTGLPAGETLVCCGYTLCSMLRLRCFFTGFVGCRRGGRHSGHEYFAPQLPILLVHDVVLGFWVCNYAVKCSVCCKASVAVDWECWWRGVGMENGFGGRKDVRGVRVTFVYVFNKDLYFDNRLR